MEFLATSFSEMDRACPKVETAESVSTVAPILLRARGLHKHFGGQSILDGVDIDLRQGEVVLLKGENGAGKTTFLNILTGNLAPDSGEITYLANDSARTFRFPRKWWEELNPFDHFAPEFVAREGVGRTWQDVRLFQAQSLLDNIAVATQDQPGENPVRALVSSRFSRQREAQVIQDANSLLAQFGLNERVDSSADKISLGQSKRVAIARALAGGAKILFLDEPLAGLDRHGIADILELLTSLVKDHAVTLVIVEHVFNLSHLQKLVTVEWSLNDGKMVRSELNQLSDASCLSSIQVKSNSRTMFDHLITSELSVTVEPLPGGASLTRVVSSAHPELGGAPVLSIKNVCVQRGVRTLAWEGPDGESGISFNLHRGEVAFLQAPNGWGKTTLLECVAGLISSASGEIFLDEIDLAELTPWERSRLGVRFVKADRNVFVSLNGSDFLRLAGANTSPASEALPLKRPISTYSGGERQQLALTAASGGAVPRIYVFDEPFSMLDSRAIDRFKALFQPDPRYGVLVSIPLIA